MGGQNHQPTSSVTLIAPSAWLSQKIGDGFSEVLQANSQLENAIIVGVNHLHVEDLASLEDSSESYLSNAIALVRRSLETEASIQTGFENLLAAADKENYRGNPLASRVRDFDLREQFNGRLVLPSANQNAWEAIVDRVESTNILATLRWEASEFEKLREPTVELVQVLEACLERLRSDGPRGFVEAIECNDIPLRQSYARVFSLWNYLHAMFLYSTLVMTELFYRTNSFGSLLTDSDGQDSQRTA
ncbi:hypothetical protein KKH81_00985 [Patescibacteria group bacterium]|nr:hypothetical protein [Patescibacteria group bacterium]